MFDPGYFDPQVFAPAELAAGAGFGPTQYFDCAYFDDTYFDVSADCGEPVAPGGGHPAKRVYRGLRPVLYDDDELLALI